MLFKLCITTAIWLLSHCLAQTTSVTTRPIQDKLNDTHIQSLGGKSNVDKIAVQWEPYKSNFGKCFKSIH